MQIPFITKQKESILASLLTSTSTKSSTSHEPKRPFWLFILLVLTFLGIGIWALLTFEEAVVQNPDGTFRLSEKRQKKMDDEIKALQTFSEQYVLLATKSKWYPCVSCPKGAMIYLNAGEVWRYGTTRYNERGRYNKDYCRKNDLEYIVQFEGFLHLCLIEEKRKIYHYPLLPENLKRSVRLARPPYNSVDR